MTAPAEQPARDGGYIPFAGCTEACADSVPCPTCGRDLPPIGRAVPSGAYLPSCCDEARFDSTINTRHIWNVSELPVSGVDQEDETT